MSWHVWAWVLLGVAAFTAVTLIYAMVLEPRWIVPRRRRRWVENRTPLSDSRYAEAIGVPLDHAGIAAAAREALASKCVVPPEAIQPGDTLAGLAPLMLDHWEEFFAAAPIERRLGVALSDQVVNEMPSLYGAPTVGEWSRRVAEHVLRHVPKAEPSAAGTVSAPTTAPGRGGPS
jgi:hypothetical protein